MISMAISTVLASFMVIGRKKYFGHFTSAAPNCIQGQWIKIDIIEARTESYPLTLSLCIMYNHEERSIGRIKEGLVDGEWAVLLPSDDAT